MSRTQYALQAVSKLKDRLRRPPKRDELMLEPEDGDGTLRMERVREMLQAAADWRLVRGGKALHRRYEFSDRAVAFSFSQFVMELASYTRLPLFVRLSGAQVTLTLQNVGKAARRGPLTDELLKLVAIF
jgi:pterin-4a-carbinolamine dehydratase